MMRDAVVVVEQVARGRRSCRSRWPGRSRRTVQRRSKKPLSSVMAVPKRPMRRPEMTRPAASSVRMYCTTPFSSRMCAAGVVEVGDGGRVARGVEGQFLAEDAVAVLLRVAVLVAEPAPLDAGRVLEVDLRHAKDRVGRAFARAADTRSARACRRRCRWKR